MKEDADARLSVASQQAEYVLDKGKTNVDFSLMSNRKMNVEANLFNEQNKLVGTTTAQADSGATWAGHGHSQ